MAKKKSIRSYFDRWPDYFGDKEGAGDLLLCRGDEMTFYPSNGCYGFLPYVVDNKLTAVYASLWCRYEDLYEAALEYWNFLFDPAVSPFRKALDGLKVVYRKDGKPIAVGLHDMNASTQVCVTFLMQTRIPQENTNKLRSFKFWRDNGFSVAEAFFISEHILRLQNGTLTFWTDRYPHAFNAVQGISWKKFIEGTPTLVLKGWASGETKYRPPLGRDSYASSRPTVIWAGKPSPIFDLLKSSGKYAGNFESSFKKLCSTKGVFPSKGIVSEKECIEILKKTKDKWTST